MSTKTDVRARLIADVARWRRAILRSVGELRYDRALNPLQDRAELHRKLASARREHMRYWRAYLRVR